MFRILITFIITAFLFIGILSTADSIYKSDLKNTKELSVQVKMIEPTRPSIKEIDRITADNNYYFTSENSLR